MKWVNQTIHRILLMKLLTSDEEMITDNLPQAERSPGHRAAAGVRQPGGGEREQQLIQRRHTRVNPGRTVQL